MNYKLIISTLGIVLGLVFFTWYFSDIVTYVLISILLASILRPIANKISSVRYKNISFPRSLAVLVSYFILLGGIFGFVSIFTPLVNDQITIIQSIKPEKISNELKGTLTQLKKTLDEHGIETEIFLKDSINQNISSEATLNQEYIVNLLEQKKNILLGFSDVSKVFDHIISFTGSFLIGFMAISFITFFLVLENNLLSNLLYKMVPNRYFEITITALYKTQSSLSGYFTGVFLQMLFVFVLLTIGLSLIGVPNAYTIALFAAIVNFIPYIGPLLGSAFCIIVQFITVAIGQNSPFGWYEISEILIVFLSVQLTDNILLQPIIFSRSVKAHPLEIFVVIFAGAKLAGMLGMVLAIPGYTILKVIISEFYYGFTQNKVFKKRINN